MKVFSLKHSFWLENQLIKRDLEEGLVEGFREAGLNQYHLKRRDTAEFMGSRTEDRLNFAVENGLISEEI